ncbi:hypothetical protein FRC12_021993 [Ceratobasidium sp. 428]|nr:hypothetical protein FRC12_021993 [Ceratobasidium sp. 428]
MSSARHQFKPSATSLESTYPPVQRLIISHTSSPRAASPVSAAESITGTRRSTRTRRPSNHKLESDAYQAASQATSRASTPSQATPKSKPKSKSGKSKSKKPWGERGARPGRIVQPDPDPEPSSDEGSPRPLAEAGSNSSRSRLADQRLARNSLDAVDREEAVCRALVALGSDASRLSTKTIKQVLAAVKDYEEDTQEGPMEVEGGSAPALLQSTGQVVLGSRHQPPAGGVTDDAAALGSTAPGQHVEVLVDGSATESEPEPEFVELGPDDSISQRIPPVHHTLLYPQPTPAPRSSLKPAHKPSPIVDKSEESDTNTDTVDTDDDPPIVRPLKRQRLTPPFRGPLPPRPVPSHAQVSTASSAGPAATSASRHSHTTSNHPSTSALPQPPPIADLNAVLAWAAQLAKQTATGQGTHVTNEYGVLARVLDDLRLSQLAAPNPLKRQRTESAKEHAAVLEAEAAFTLGKNRPRHRPSLDDYPGFRRHIATLAIPELLAASITEGGYDEHPKAIRRAEICYNRVWERELRDIPIMKAPPPLLGIMTHRNSWSRGQATERVRSAVISEYGLISPARTSADVKYNRRLIKRALPNGFYCPNLEPGANEYQHPGLNKCFASAFFWAPESVGAVYHDIFYPLSRPAVAMGLTITQHCLAEWKSGYLQRRVLHVENERLVYEEHLRGLNMYAESPSSQLLEFQKDWFWYGMDYAGVAQDRGSAEPTTHTDRVRSDSSSRDRDTELGDRPSSAKPDKHHRHHHHRHHHHAHSKGKGRAAD